MGEQNKRCFEVYYCDKIDLKLQGYAKEYPIRVEAGSPKEAVARVESSDWFKQGPWVVVVVEEIKTCPCCKHSIRERVCIERF